MTPHWTTGRDPRQNLRLLFPSRTVQTLRRLDRLRALPRHHPTNKAEFDNIDTLKELLFNIFVKVFFACVSYIVGLKFGSWG